MKTKILKYCDIDLDEATKVIKVVIYGGDNKSVRYDLGSKIIDLNSLEAKIKDYWVFVDDKIREGIVTTNNARDLKAFYDDLKTKGGIIANILLTQEMRNSLWRHANEADIFVLWTDAEWVPWESLYNPDSTEGAFLSDNCVISRVPTTTNADFVDDLEDEESRGRIICIDPVLEKEISAEGGGDSVAGRFVNIGEDVYFTELKDDFKKKISGKQIISWICEHEMSKGLRLCSDIYFSSEDTQFHRFPKGSVVVMISCQGARSSAADYSFSRNIVSSSHCTVVAPSSVISAKAGIDFVLRLVTLMKNSGSVEMHELWALLKRPFGGSLGSEDKITPEKCYALWFNIYGDCEVRLEEATG